MYAAWRRYYGVVCDVDLRDGDRREATARDVVVGLGVAAEQRAARLLLRGLVELPRRIYIYIYMYHIRARRQNTRGRRRGKREEGREGVTRRAVREARKTQRARFPRFVFREQRFACFPRVWSTSERRFLERRFLRSFRFPSAFRSGTIEENRRLVDASRRGRLDSTRPDPIVSGDGDAVGRSIARPAAR